PRTSWIEAPSTFTSRTSRRKRRPPQASHGTNTLARNTISTSTWPAPSHSSQRPPGTLNENVLGVKRRSRECEGAGHVLAEDRKSTRPDSSHLGSSDAVF